MAKEATVQKKTATYVLRKGQKHSGFDANGGRHTFVGGENGNDRVELTEAQAKAFADKFDSLKELQARAKAHEIMSNDEDDEGGETAKKPDPHPSVGTAEPTSKDVQPAPTGSTSDPVDGAKTSPAEAAKPAQNAKPQK